MVLTRNNITIDLQVLRFFTEIQERQGLWTAVSSCTQYTFILRSVHQSVYLFVLLIQVQVTGYAYQTSLSQQPPSYSGATGSPNQPKIIISPAYSGSLKPSYLQMPRYQHVNSQYQYQQDYMILDTQFDTNLIRKKR